MCENNNCVYIYKFCSCPARGKIVIGEPNIILLNTGHQHNHDREMRDEFRRMLHLRARDERVSLRVIYDEVAALPNFRQIDIAPFEAHRRQMARTRSANRPPNPASMTDFHQQLENQQYTNLIKVQDQCFYHGRTGLTAEEGVTLIFVTPHVRK